MAHNVEDKYMSLVNSGELQYDENQYQIILQFMKVQQACKLPKLKYEDSTAASEPSQTSSFWGSLWKTVSGSGSGSGGTSSPSASVDASSVEGSKNKMEDRRGMYLYGSVGIG